jgi:RNA polymerase sigma factor (sigma-70 family)
VSVASDPAPPPGPGDYGPELSGAYLDHAPAVYRRACRAALGDHQAAEDATQQAFMEAFRNWPEFRQLPPGEQRARLCARARWRIIDSWHATSHEITTDTLPDQPDPTSCEDNVLADITIARFWREITTVVPPRAARAAYLRWHERWKMAAVGEHLGVDRATVLRDLNSVLNAAKQLGVQIGLPPCSEGEEA